MNTSSESDADLADVDVHGLDGGVAARRTRGMSDESSGRAIIKKTGRKNILLNRILPQLPPDPTLLEPSKRNIRMNLVRTINPRRPRLQLMRESQSPTNILRKHRRRQSIQRIVRLSQHIGFVLELDNDTDGPEDLFLDDAHVWLRVGEDGGFDPVAFFAVTDAAELDCCAFGFAGFDVGHDALSEQIE